jgi:hypothetical protein
MISLLALIALAAFIGYKEAKEQIAIELVQTTKWVVALSAPLWLGGLLSIVAVFLLFQAVYIPVRNKFQGKPIWFIDEETYIGSKITQYLGQDGGRILFFIELFLAILLLVL